MPASRRLYLYRHAKSDWTDPTLDDIDRPLNTRGRKAAEVMARHIVDRGWVPDFIVCSPSRRTRATLDRLLAKTGSLPVAIEEVIYEAHPDEILGYLRSIKDSYQAVMVIGHNPGIESLAARLAGDGGRENSMEKFPTAALAVFDVMIDQWLDLDQRGVTFAEFVRSRDLK